MTFLPKWSDASLAVGAGLTALLAISAPVRAEVMASALAGYSGVNQIVCYLANAGSSAITVSGPKIMDASGTVSTNTVNSCGSSLPGGRVCVWAVDLPANTPFARYQCRVDLSSKANARGSLDLRVRGLAAGPSVVFSIDMR